MITDEDRRILERNLAKLRIDHAEFERNGQKNMAAITRDDICWIEIKLGLNDPAQPLVPSTEVELRKFHQAKRMGIVDEILNNFDELIRHSMDYAGPRKYQEVVKICTMADKVRHFEAHDVAGYQNQLGQYIHADELVDGENVGYDAIGGGGMIPIRNVNALDRPAARPAPLQDMTRILTDYLDKANKLTEERDKRSTLPVGDEKFTIYGNLHSLFEIRKELLARDNGLNDPQTEHLAVIDRQINETLDKLNKHQENTDDSDASATDRPADPDVVLPELPRGHSAPGDERVELRHPDDEADSPGGAGDRQAGRDRREETMESRWLDDHPFG